MTNTYEINQRALNKHNQDTLGKIALYNTCPEYRKMAVEKIIVPGILLEVATYSKDNDIILEVIKKLINTPHLELILFQKNKKLSVEVILFVIEKVYNQEILLNIFKNYTEPSIRRATFEKLTDEYISLI